MRRGLSRALLAAAALGLAAAPARAQDQSRLINSPAERFQIAPGGVDMRTGRYVYDETDLAIGGEDGGLVLKRTLTQPVLGHVNPFGNLSHNWDILVSERMINIEHPGQAAGDYQIEVHFGGRSQTFRSRFQDTGYAPVSDGPITTLTYTGTRASASVVYTYQAADGTVALFRPLGTVGAGDCSATRRCAYVSQVTEPDGTVYTFDYAPTGATGGSHRLARVTSSRGYALLLEGSGHRVTRACAINLALGPAPANNSCPQDAQAIASYAYGADGRLAAATGPDNATSAFTYAGSSSMTVMGFVRPGETQAWLTNTIGLVPDEDGLVQEVVGQQSFIDGQSYSYSFGGGPVTNSNPYPPLAGGSYVHAGGTLSYSVDTPFAWPLLHGMNYPGSPCTQLPCSPPMPDGFLNYVYQQTPGPVEIVDALGRTTTFDYCDPLPMAHLPALERNRCVVVPLVSFTDPEGARTELQYDGRRNIARVTRHPRPGSTLAPIVTMAVYDIYNQKSSSRPLSMTDAMGNTTNYTYAPEHGGVLTETAPAPAPGGVRPQTRHQYAQRHAWIANGAGGWTQAATPVWLRTATSTCRTSAATGNPASPCATAGDEVRTAYDYGPNSGPNTLLLRGQTVTATDNGATTVLRTCYAYDALGRKISETQPNANLASCPAGPPASAMPYTSSTRYDAANRVTGTISADPDAAGSGHPQLAVRNSYDPAGRPIKVETGTLAAWQSEAVAPANWTGFTVLRTAETSYDAMGRKTRESLREGPSTGSGQAQAGPVRSVTQYSYDPLGRLECTAVRMNPADFLSPPASACAQGTGGADRISRNIYDLAGQRLQVRAGVGTSVEGAQATWAYNASGQVVTMIDGNGNRAELRYDGHGRQDRWTFPSATRPASFNDATPATALATAGSVNAADYEEYGYDPNGNRISLRKRDNTTLGFTFDALNRVTVKTVPERAGLDPIHTRDVHYGYDLRGLQTFARFDSASGEGITTGYDGFGRVRTTSTNMGGVTRTLSYINDADGNRLRIDHPDGVFFSYLFDGLDRPVFLFENGMVWHMIVPYTPEGGPSAHLLSNGGIRAFGYDALQRPSTYVHIFAASPAVTWTLARNAAGQIGSIARDNDAYAWTGAYNTARPYATNGLNQYSVTGQPDTAGSVAFTYDANGNLASEAMWNGTTYIVSASYTYDVENRLVGRSGGGAGAALSYDPLGRLYEVTGGGNTTRFLYDGDALVAEYDGSGVMTRRYAHWFGADVPAVSYQGSGLAQRSHLHADHQGSIVALSSASGAATINSYDEYGIPGAGNTGRFQYTGQIWLAELGMYHYKARIYSPTLGRFLQTDPVGYADQNNLYAYVGNDPINRTDPTGRYLCGGDKEQCDAVATSLKIMRTAAKSPELSRADRNILNRISDFYGQEGRRNKVVVMFMSQRDISLIAGRRTGGATVLYTRNHVVGVVLPNSYPRMFNDIPGSSSAIGRPNFSPEIQRANVLTHEGQHGADIRDARGFIRNPEPAAYHAGHLVNQAFGADSTSE